MTKNFTELDELMSFDSQNINIFQEPAKINANPNIYKTSPKQTKSEDGHYHCRVRLLYNPLDRKRTIVHSATYTLHDKDGYFTVKSLLGENSPASPYFRDYKSCPIFKGWKKLHFSDDESLRTLADEVYKKNESDYILVQVVEDNNQPELVGSILAWRLPKAVSAKLENKLYPSKDSGRVPVNVLDYLTGRVLDIDVTPGPEDKAHPERYYRETNYDLSEFEAEVTPIMKVDGTPLFDEAQIELIEKYDKKITTIQRMKSPEEKEKSFNLLKENKLYAQVKELMQIANAYLRDNCVDLVDELSYKPWDQETTDRVNAYIAIASQGKNPADSAGDIDDMFKLDAPIKKEPAKSLSNIGDDDDMLSVGQVGGSTTSDDDDDDLPF